MHLLPQEWCGVGTLCVCIYFHIDYGMVKNTDPSKITHHNMYISIDNVVAIMIVVLFCKLKYIYNISLKMIHDSG